MPAQKYDEFNIDGIGFRLGPLPALVAEKLSPNLIGFLTPAFAAMVASQEQDVAKLGQALAGLSGSAEQLPKFREAFAAQCSVVIGEVEGKVIWSELKGNVFDETFRRKHKRYFEWLGKCLELEYGDFLAEIGQQLALALKANPLSSLIGFPGASGDSPATPESKTDSPTS